jgi:hypothetical protein
MINNKGMPASEVADFLNEKRLPEINATLDPNDSRFLKKIYYPTFTYHFSKKRNPHCQDFQLLKLHFMQKKANKKKESAPEIKEFMDQEYFQEAEFRLKESNRGLTEYSSLSTMIESLEIAMEYYDKQIKDKITNNQRLTIHEIDAYQKQVAALFKLKRDLTALRNTVTIAGEAVHTAISLTTTQFFELLLLVTEDVRHTLRAEMPQSSLPDEIVTNIRQRLSDVVKPQSEAIFEKVTRKYNLR